MGGTVGGRRVGPRRLTRPSLWPAAAAPGPPAVPAAGSGPAPDPAARGATAAVAAGGQRGRRPPLAVGAGLPGPPLQGRQEWARRGHPPGGRRREVGLVGGRAGRVGGRGETDPQSEAWSPQGRVARDGLDSGSICGGACWGLSPRFCATPSLRSGSRPPSTPPHPHPAARVGEHLLGRPRQAEAWRREQEARSEGSRSSRVQHPCTSPCHTRVTDSPPAGAPRGTSQPLTLALHANTMLAAPSCPGHPRLPLRPARSPRPLAPDTHAHLVLCPRSARD